MKKTLRVLVVGAMAGAIALTASPLVAKKGEIPPGQAKKQGMVVESHHEDDGERKTRASEETPPGWSRGKKTGWGGGAYPPGWSKWDKNRQIQWSSDRDRARGEIRIICDRYRISSAKRNEITNAFNQAIVGGLVINDATSRLTRALENEQSRRNIMIDTTQAVLELLR